MMYIALMCLWSIPSPIFMAPKKPAQTVYPAPKKRFSAPSASTDCAHATGSGYPPGFMSILMRTVSMGNVASPAATVML